LADEWEVAVVGFRLENTRKKAVAVLVGRQYSWQCSCFFHMLLELGFNGIFMERMRRF
jgi:hypothetical protein